MCNVKCVSMSVCLNVAESINTKHNSNIKIDAEYINIYYA